MRFTRERINAPFAKFNIEEINNNFLLRQICGVYLDHCEPTPRASKNVSWKESWKKSRALRLSYAISVELGNLRDSTMAWK